MQRKERRFFSSSSLSSRGLLPVASSSRVHATAMLPELTCIMSRYRFLVRVRAMKMISRRRGVAKATDLVGRYNEIIIVRPGLPPPGFPAREIIGPRFWIPFYTTVSSYGDFLNRPDTRGCSVDETVVIRTSFFCLKATPVGAEGAALPVVCRLPVVPGCACVRFWRAITGLS